VFVTFWLFLLYQNFVVLESELLAGEWDVQYSVAGLDFADGEATVVDDAAYVERLAVLGLTCGGGIGRNIGAVGGLPITMEIDQDLIFRNGIFSSAPSYIAGAMAGQEFSRDQSALEVGSGDVNGFAVVFTADESSGRHLSIARSHPAKAATAARTELRWC